MFEAVLCWCQSVCGSFPAEYCVDGMAASFTPDDVGGDLDITSEDGTGPAILQDGDESFSDDSEGKCQATD